MTGTTLRQIGSGLVETERKGAGMLKEIPSEEARQGRNSLRMLIVLGVSFCLAFGILTLLYLYVFTGSYPEHPLNSQNKPAATSQQQP
ncbi:hypothetical protein ABID16_003372 [Rhizobium aquaticum]|uniref:Uncharacterized protein n=1 Tax=Rhizobium aquaticum TaxID=1549636 RepID=A0ABV2J2P1_9HYPH